MDENNSNTFTIRPTGKTLSLKAGQQEPGSITVINQADSKDSFTFQASVVPYGVEGEGYEANLVTATEQTQLANWITFENPKGTLAPGESVEVNYTINVPKDAPGGGQYAAIIISSDSNTDADSSSVVDYVYEMSCILYSEIQGKTVHSGSIINHSAPAFSTSPKISTMAKLENNGNIHEYAKILLTVTDFFTGEDIFTNKEAEAPTTEIIMPNTQRQLINNIDDLPSLGIITVKESISYLGESSTIEQRVIICPIWFMSLVALTILSIIVAIVHRIIRRHRKHSKDKSEIHL